MPTGHKHAEAWEVRTVVLDHQCGPSSHYDWMVEDPQAPAGEGLLCTWRMPIPPSRWAAAGQIELTRLGDHRRAYLTYEGEISGGRGSVRRIDEGEATIVSWSQQAAVIEVRLRAFDGRVTLRRIDGDRWVMVVVTSG